MKTVGEILKEARVQKKISLSKLEKETKIKKVFLEAVEKESWSALPDYPVVLGFVRSMATELGLDPEKVVAVLRRDYPPKDLPVNPKPDVSKKFVWSPKLTFLVGVVLVAVALFGYLVFEYVSFSRPPKLEVFSPQENQVITENKIFVEGKTDSDATITINNQPSLVDDEGNFLTEIEVSEQTSEILIKAESRSGKVMELKRKIKVEIAS